MQSVHYFIVMRYLMQTFSRTGTVLKSQQRSPSHKWRARIFLASFAVGLFSSGCFKTVYAQDNLAGSSYSVSPPGNVTIQRAETTERKETLQQDLADALSPRDSLMFSNRGYVRSRVGDLRGALEDFDTAISMDGKNIEAFSGRGYLRLYNSDGKGAISDFNQALAVDSKNASALCGRGQAHADMGDEKEALADFNLAIKLDPTNAPSYIFRGYHLERHGDQPRAIADFDQTIKLDPSNALAYCYRGTAREAVKDNQGAVSDFSTVIKFDPQYAWAYYRRGQARDQLGDKIGAIADFNQYIKLKPADPWGFRARGFTRQKNGEIKAAIRDYSHAIELEKTDPWTFSARGFLRGKTGDLRGSISDYQQASKLERHQNLVTTKATGKSATRKNSTTRATKSSEPIETTNTGATAGAAATDTARATPVATTDSTASAAADETARATKVATTDSTTTSSTKAATSAVTVSTSKVDATTAAGATTSETSPTISLITNPVVYAFSAKTLADAQQSFGPPITKIKQILIFHRPGPHCQTMMWDADKGIFCIFMANENIDAYFQGNLGHELLHLLNAKLCDPYVEGLCSVFGEEALTSDKRATYQSLLTATPFYKETYLMMKEMKERVSAESYGSIFRFAKYDPAKLWMHIDIDQWMQSIPPAEQVVAREIIGKFAGQVEATMPKDGVYVFSRPSGG